MTTVYIPVEVEKELPKEDGTYIVMLRSGEVCEAKCSPSAKHPYAYWKFPVEISSGAGITHWLKKIPLDLSEDSIEKMANEKFPFDLSYIPNDMENHVKLERQMKSNDAQRNNRHGYVKALQQIRQLLSP